MFFVSEYVVVAVLLPDDAYVEVVTLQEAEDKPVEVPVGAVVAVDVSVTYYRNGARVPLVILVQSPIWHMA